MGIGLAIAFLFAGFILGFLVGARARQITAKMKAFGKAVFSIHVLLKIKEAVAGMDDAEAVNDGEDDDDSGKGDDAKNQEELLDEFLNTDAVDGLEDHPDIVISPVFMHQIKKAKDQERLEKQKALLMAEGLTEAEAEDRMANGLEGGPVGDMRQNPLAVLIAAGARVEAVRGATSDDAVRKQDLRRKQRNISVYISKQFDIDMKVAPKKADEGELGAKGGKKSALDVAKETKLKPVGGETYNRELRAMSHAKSARVLLKEFKIKDDLAKKAMKKTSADADDDDTDLAALDDEDAGEEGAEGEEEGGEEGEEGEEFADAEA